MKKKLSIGIIALIGFITTIKLAIIYYEANFNPYALSSFCSINSFIDCDGVAKTTESQFFGIPLAFWGMLFYVFTLMLLFVDKIKQIKFLEFFSVFKHPMYYISSLGFISFVVSVFLAFSSLFVLHKICILCFFTYILNAVIALIATDFNDGGFVKSFKVSFQDFVDGVKSYKYHFIVAVLLAVAFLTYSTVFYPFAPQVKRIESINEYLHMTTNPYIVNGNNLGNPNAPIKVDLYSDYKCPMCAAYNIMIHKAVKELGNVYVVSHNLPLDKACNCNIKGQVHKGACQMARYAVAAGNQGKYWNMTSLLFETHPKTNEEAVNLAEKLGLNIDKFKADINSESTNLEIKKDIYDATSQGIIGTPTIVVNGKIYLGIKPYYELKKILQGKE